MPLTLVTGPANAAKAGAVLGGLRARLDEEPILVVPAFTDVEHAQRELAAHGAVFGVRVLRFDWLFGEIALRAGYDARIASDVQRELIVEQAASAASLEVLAQSAAQPGFARAATRFMAELGRSAVGPARLTRALRDWAGEGPRRAYAEEVAAITRGYHAGLERAGLVDAELFAQRALGALAEAPERWGRTPVFAYGFDDFTPLELDALETLARRCEVDVTVSLPFEPGREAFRATAAVRSELEARGASELRLDPVDEHYAERSRAALHTLERRLFEGPAEGEPGIAAAGAIEFHLAGGERAEVELVGKRALELLRTGVEPGDIAVVFREPGGYASLVEQVFGAYGIPYSIDRRVPFGHTAIGRGLLALIRAASPGGSADDLLAYLRAPGLLRQPGFADDLEKRAREAGAESAAEARALWEGAGRFPLDVLDRVRDAASPAELAAVLSRVLARLFAAPHRRRAAVLRGSELDEARALRAGEEALAGLALVATGGAAPAERVKRVLEQLEVHVGESAQPDRVQVTAPEAIRARRFGVVFVCGLQEGEFPGGAAPEPFLSDDDRRGLATASGLALPVREERLARERYLFYVCASRAERLLVLSSRTSDEEGNPQAESFFVEEVRDLLEPAPEPVERSLADVTWPPDDPPTAAEWERALAAAGPHVEEPGPLPLSSGALLEELAGRDAVSAGALERFADCPVKWLVESLLHPVELVPQPEAMVRGEYAHKVLERTFARVREETGERRVTHANLGRAEQILLEELRERRSEFQISPKETRFKAAARRLEFDLLRYLRNEADRDGAFEPDRLELEFGLGDGGEPVEIAEGLRVRGRIDRVDTRDGRALVIDYKSGRKVDRYKVASWESENRFQAALYMLVVERLLGVEAVGGVYVALGNDKDPRPRGMVSAEAPDLGSGFVENDRLTREEFRERLEQALERIVETHGRMRRGELCARPSSCDWNGGCKYPAICRSER